MSAIKTEPEHDPVVGEAVERRDRDDGGDAGRDRHRDGEDVVDEQRRAGDERRVLAEVLAADDVAAAAARVGEDRLAVRERRRSRAGARPRSRSGPACRGPSARLDAADRGDEEDLLGGVRGRRDRVGGEDRQRDRLRDALVLLLGRGERPADEQPLDDRQHPDSSAGPAGSVTCHLTSGRTSSVHAPYGTRMPGLSTRRASFGAVVLTASRDR